MATRMNIALVLVVVLAAVSGKIAAVDHIVGGSMGWGIPSGPAAYANWASQQTFKVGDTLVFNFATGQHDVAKVAKSAYDSCSSTGPVTLITVGPANVTLNSTGEQHFICTFGQHCSAGQKLAINVTAASSPTPSPAPSPATTPSPSPTPTPTPMPAPTAAPTPSTTPSPSPMTTPSPSPSMGPSASSPSPSGGAATSPSSSPSTGPITPGTTPSPATPSDGLTPPPAPSSAPRNFFAPALIMFMSTAITIMW